MKLEFSQQIFQKYANIKLHENGSMGAEMFHADGRTDMTKLEGVFHDCAQQPKGELNKLQSSRM
jgi:hypothetical protein